MILYKQFSFENIIIYNIYKPNLKNSFLKYKTKQYMTKNKTFSEIMKGPRTSRAEPAHRYDVNDTHTHKLTTRDSRLLFRYTLSDCLTKCTIVSIACCARGEY